MKLFKYLFVLFVILLLPWGNTEAQRMYTYGTNIGSESAGANINVNATLGADLITWNESAWDEDDSTWTMTTTGPLVHVTGNTTAVTGTVTGALTAGVTYQVTITGTGGTATATYTLGGVTGTTLAASGAIAIEDYITATADSELVITPANTCTVSITSVTVKALTDATGDGTVQGDLFVGSTIKSPGGTAGINILPSGYVGIGTSSPSDALHINKGDKTGIIIGDPGASRIIIWGRNSDDGCSYIYSVSSSDFKIMSTSGNLNLQPTGGNVKIGTAQITAGSGTGITVNSTGHLNRLLYKVTTVFGAYTDTDTTKGIVIATLPAKTKLVGCYADTTVAYTGGAVSAATLEVGVTAEGAAEILAAHNVLAAAILAGDADAEMGTSMTRAAAIQGGYLPSWSATTAIYATIDTTTANTDALTAGSTTFYLITERY